MNKKTKNYTVIIVADATSANKEFIVSSKLIKNAILAFTFLLVFFGFIVFHYLSITLDKQKMHRLELENVEKEKKLSELTSTIDKLNTRLKKMEDYKEKIMVATGLTSPQALTEVGSGGEPLNPQSEFGFSEGMGIEANPPLSNEINKANIIKSAREIDQKAQKTEDTLKNIEAIIDTRRMQLAATPAIWPTRGFITAAFGNRIHPFTGKWEFHNGIDIATQLGNKIIAPADGTVLVTENRQYYGNMILIDHGFGYTTRYGHLSQTVVREGQRIKRFDVIGYVGNTGRSTAPHLHYEVRYFDNPMNPNSFILD